MINYKYLIFLQKIYNFNNIKIMKIINNLDLDLKEYDLDKMELLRQKLYECNYDRSKKEYILSNKLISQEIFSKSYDDFSKILKYLEKNPAIKIVTYQDEKYPQKRLEILKLDKPVILYYLGDIDIINKKTIAIIGTRNVDDKHFEYGKKMAMYYSKNFTILSGLAKGCDTSAHIGCLSAKGKTIAILPGGLDKIYPKENIELAKDIYNNSGCLLSEYPPKTKIEIGFFGKRDRLQAAMSDYIIVVQTGVIGGTMITVGYGLEYNKKIYAVNSNESLGGKKLILEQKAIPISEEKIIKIGEIYEN